MLRDLASWWRRQREAGALHGIIAGLGLTAIGLLLLWASSRPAAPRHLSKKAQAQLNKRAGELAPEAIHFARELSLRTRELDESSDSETIHRYSDWVVSWSERFTAALEAEVALWAEKEGVYREEVRRYLAARLQELTGACVPELSAAPGSSLTYLCACPRVTVAAATAQEAMEAAIQKLLALLPKLPSQGQEGVKKAILALRRAIAPFDTKSIAIVFTSPVSNAIVNSIPPIEFVMTDTGSGVNAATRQLKATNTGPIIQQTTDLTGFTVVTLEDPVAGKVIVATGGIPETALQDGYITLQASGTDFAANAATVATHAIVLDRQAPEFTISSPQGIVSGSSAQLSAVVKDAVSGVKPSSIKVTLNGQDVTANLTIVIGSATAAGGAQSVSLSGTLSVQSGTNTLTITASDLAGNDGTASATFAIAAVASFPIEPGLAVTLEKIEGDERSGFSGQCAPLPLRVRVRRQSGTLVEGVVLTFALTSGIGTIEPARGFTTVSDAQGIAAVRYRFGAQDETIAVTAVNATTLNAVSFTEHGQPVDLILGFGQIDGGITEPLVSALTGGDLPGSALPEVMQFFGPAGATVKADVVDAQGIPLDDADSIGRFVPNGAVLTSFDGSVTGTTRFMFVLSKDAPVGPIYLKFSLPQYRGADGKPISKIVKSEVLSPDAAPARIVSGQGQVGRPDHPVSDKLVAKLVLQNAPGADSLFFAILPSAPISSTLLSPGFFDVDPSVEHQFIDLFGPKTGVIVKVGTDLTAAVTYTLGTDPGPIRIVVSPSTLSSGPTLPPSVGEVFCVGPPEIRIVRRLLKRDADGTLARDTDGNFIVSKNSDAKDRFDGIRVPPFVGTEFVRSDDTTLHSTGPRSEILVEARLPMETGSVQAVLRSFDKCGELLSLPEALAPSFVSLSLLKGEPIPGGFMYRSGEIVAASELKDSSSVLTEAKLPEGEILIQAEHGGALTPSLAAGVVDSSESFGPSERFESALTIVIMLDGGRREILTETVLDSKLPKFFNRAFPPKARKRQEAHAVFPTVTIASFASIVSGEHPRFTGFPGNEFINRYAGLLEDPGKTHHFAFYGGAILKTQDLTITIRGVELPLQRDLVLAYTVKKDKSIGLANDY